MSDYKKALMNALLGLGSLASVSILWQEPALLVVILITFSLLMLKVRTEKRSLIVYLIGFVFGPLAEAVAISQGAWTYTGYVIPVIEIPIWLPFLWANAALFIVNTEKLSNILFNSKSSKP